MSKPMEFHPDEGDQRTRRKGKRSEGYVPYVYSEELILAVNAALATDRPLLLRGNPGCGKSSAAKDIALALKFDYYPEVITSKTTATDLLWRFDAVKRLTEANAGVALSRGECIDKGVLWRAFEPGASGAVVLLDEIDKADPDVPNDLLVPIGEGHFTVLDADRDADGELPEVARARKVLVILTSNGERELPPAFLRRCVSLTVRDPLPDELVRIAQQHQKARNAAAKTDVPFDEALVRAIIDRVEALSVATTGARRAGTAEILDAFKAAVALGIDATSDQWKLLTQVLLYKETAPPPA